VRTTIDIPDEVYRRLKVKAASEGQTVRAIALRAIGREIDAPVSRPVRRFELPVLKAHAPGTLKIDNERIYDLIGFP
jgi:plasmid stability protein